MSKKRTSTNTKKPAAAPAMDKDHVRVSYGGRQPIVLDYKEGETYQQLFERANAKPTKSQTVTTEKKPIKDFSQPVTAGSTIVIANKSNNG